MFVAGAYPGPLRFRALPLSVVACELAVRGSVPFRSVSPLLFGNREYTRAGLGPERPQPGLKNLG